MSPISGTGVVGDRGLQHPAVGEDRHRPGRARPIADPADVEALKEPGHHGQGAQHLVPLDRRRPQLSACARHRGTFANPGSPCVTKSRCFDQP
jgi:hypothetical protein